jgi:hypothetical protein
MFQIPIHRHAETFLQSIKLRMRNSDHLSPFIFISFNCTSIIWRCRPSPSLVSKWLPCERTSWFRLNTYLIFYLALGLG